MLCPSSYNLIRISKVLISYVREKYQKQRTGFPKEHSIRFTFELQLFELQASPLDLFNTRREGTKVSCIENEIRSKVRRKITHGGFRPSARRLFFADSITSHGVGKSRKTASTPEKKIKNHSHVTGHEQPPP